jgi:tetratricopeptide (TPR) repeat protein
MDSRSRYLLVFELNSIPDITKCHFHDFNVPFTMMQINFDLTYSVCFNLANSYYLLKMHDEALNTYNLIVKNKQYPQSGRLRVNMGNIYYEQKKYPMAVKMYRMALDQVPLSTIVMIFSASCIHHDEILMFRSLHETDP